MIRTARLALAVVGCVLACGPVVAQGAPSGSQPDNEDSRFTFHRAEGGFLRLDGHSGQVSLCTRRPVGWLCQELPQERTALEAEITRLQADNATLKKELLARNLPLPAGMQPDRPPAVTDGPRLQMPTDQEIDRMVTVIEKVWRRLVEMIVSVQRDLLKKS